MEYYAHSKEGAEPKDWQPLGQHLGNVATRAARFAGIFETHFREEPDFQRMFTKPTDWGGIFLRDSICRGMPCI